MDPSVFDYLGEEHEKIQWEKGPLQKIAKEGNYRHHVMVWKCGCTEDRLNLRTYETGNARWKIW